MAAPLKRLDVPIHRLARRLAKGESLAGLAREAGCVPVTLKRRIDAYNATAAPAPAPAKRKVAVARRSVEIPAPAPAPRAEATASAATPEPAAQAG